MRAATLVSIVALASLLGACAAPAATGPSAAEPSISGGSLKTPEELLAWIDAHPRYVGCAAFEPGHEAEGLYLHADERFALASTRKVLILGAYAEAVASGALRADELISLGDIERWYWRGTDGGAHPHALDDWRARGRVAGDAVILDDVAWAMMRWSDNAAADYLLARVGGIEPVLAFARKMGMTHQEPGGPILGEFIAWSSLAERDWTSMSPADRALRADRFARETNPTAYQFGSLVTPQSQRGYAAANPGGTPREWAALMARLATGDGLAPGALGVVRRSLEWPLVVFPNNRATYTRFGAKGGSLVGVITDATYRAQGDGPVFAAALFFRDVPADAERAFRMDFTHQAFVKRLALDAAFRATVREHLARDH
jgi:beta-lactamase class A